MTGYFNQNVFFLIILAGFFSGCGNNSVANEPIRPSKEYPGYWEYKGEPILLIGGSRNDNLFQEPTAADHLRKLAEIGGNYIRNTMSSRDRGNIQPFHKQRDGKFDLNQWNDAYWQRLDNLLQSAYQYDIIVQIEIWDRFDFSPDGLKTNAFGPSSNMNYPPDTGGMDSILPKYSGSDLQPFFHTVPGMPLYHPDLDTVRKFQEKYVAKLLSYTFQYPNVLYCINNETGTPAQWGQYWLKFIREKAKEQNKEIYATDMFNSFYQVRKCQPCMRSIANPEIYQFIDASQINSRHFGQAHWDTLQVVMNLMKDYKRPVNCTKIYGGAESSWGSGTNQDGIERFCRLVVGGAASARFHRPPHGSALNELSQAAIKAVRMVEGQIKLWDVKPTMDLLGNREENEAYLASNLNDQYLLYFPTGGSVDLQLNNSTQNISIRWIGISPGNLTRSEVIQFENKISLTTPDNTGWFGVVLLD